MINVKEFVVYRMDVLSRERYPRERLLRLVKVGEDVVLDPEGKLPGRGVYVLKDVDHIRMTFQKKRLSRFVSAKRQESLMEEMIQYVQRGN